MNKVFGILFCLVPLLIPGIAFSADTVPTTVQLPGTQPLEISNLESPAKCDNCHGGYNSAVEPAHNWSGSMMAQAGRDPIFWATVAIAEQDFNGVGDLCIRCHSTGGWLAGRSTPTDGSGLAAGDADGVECDYCHKLTNPNDLDLELQGVMNPPFVANGEGQGYYGSGMSSMWGAGDKLGPYNDAEARHQFMQSSFHRDPDFCGTCHDVSNSVTGDLAPGHGALFTREVITASGTPGSDVSEKAAFNNPPYRYGVVERTFSEYKAGAISKTLVDDYPNLPDDLKGGVLEEIYKTATKGGTESADYSNPAADRYYSCQTCHMRPVTGTGANKRGVPVRRDLPLHDMTGGNYWMASVIKYLDGQGKLRLGGGMTDLQIKAIEDGALRAEQQLELAASLVVESDEVKIINHTGHKLISGYPEGRRMWLNIKWYAQDGSLLREDGAYGGIGHTVNEVEVHSIKNLEDPNLFIFEAHMGMTQAWANSLLDLGYSRELVLSYDRLNGNIEHTLGDLADLANATDAMETFHFALNNTVIEDNRIPPYGMTYAEAERRNASPVPQYLYLEENGVYEYYAEAELDPPTGAVSATIDLLYQPTSWEYIQFLYLGNIGTNTGSNTFLGNEGEHMLEAWLNTGMAEPKVMTSAAWGVTIPSCEIEAPTLINATASDKEVLLDWTASATQGVTINSVYQDQSGKAQWVADLGCAAGNCTNYNDTGLNNGQTYCYKVTASTAECESGFSNILCATPQPPGQTQSASVALTETGQWVREGKGKNATTVWVPGTHFAAGDQVVVRIQVTDDSGAPLSGATATLLISGPQSVNISSGISDENGMAEAVWATQRPNKKGGGGTTSGSYDAAVSGLNATPYVWDGVTGRISFVID